MLVASCSIPSAAVDKNAVRGGDSLRWYGPDVLFEQLIVTRHALSSTTRLVCSCAPRRRRSSKRCETNS